MAMFKGIKSFTPCCRYRVTIPWDSLLQSLARYRKNYKLIENPDFQRGHVWVEAQRIAYVEFILRGGSTGREIYFNCTSWMDGFNTPLILVDGLQRITAVERFLTNQIPAFGYLFKEYSDNIPFDCEFFFSIHNLKTRAKVLKWYIELNSGGIVHTPEEINKVIRLLEEEKEHDCDGKIFDREI